jgi:hypothetical protein
LVRGNTQRGSYGDFLAGLGEARVNELTGYLTHVAASPPARRPRCPLGPSYGRIGLEHFLVGAANRSTAEAQRARNQWPGHGMGGGGASGFMVKVRGGANCAIDPAGRGRAISGVRPDFHEEGGTVGVELGGSRIASRSIFAVAGRMDIGAREFAGYWKPSWWICSHKNGSGQVEGEKGDIHLFWQIRWMSPFNHPPFNHRSHYRVGDNVYFLGEFDWSSLLTINICPGAL